MRRYSLRFIFGTGATLVMIITMLVLGMWQMNRLEWKENHQKQLLNMDPRSFAPIEETIIDLKNIPDVNFRKVRVKGTFHHDMSIELLPRTWHGHSGAHVYTPFVLSLSGHMLLINRGWIPDKKEGIKLDDLEGEVELLGYLQQPLLPGWMTPDNVIDQKAWYYLDLEAMEEEIVKLKPKYANKLLPFYMISIETRHRDEFPKPIEVLTLVKNNHFGYALTWFFLAIALGIMYIFYIRQNRII